jgi:putative heme-binding domain-containing protein
LAGAARVPWTTSRVTGSPEPPPPFVVSRVFPHLTFRNPVDCAWETNTGRIFVAEQGGKLWSFRPGAEVERADLVLDARSFHKPLDTVLGFTFHPGFKTNRFLFLNYNEPGGRTNGAHVSRFTVRETDPPAVDPASERVLIRWRSGGHNGCTLAFGPDGFLYISTGDTADPDPPDWPLRTGQDISDLLANILRIDVDRTEGTNAYAIPPDNPFRSTPGARPEVWAYGLRNPFRMSFDRANGDLLVGDVGWEQWEMIYRVKRGGNYGWPIVEGPNPNVRTDVTPGPTPIEKPLIAVPHSAGASITGGVVYRGRRLPPLRGAYLYGDWETGRIWAARREGDRLLSNEEIADSTLRIIAFALTPEEDVLVLDYDSGLYELVPNPAGGANRDFPRRLSETGLFSDVRALTPATGVESYRPRAEMWSDGATAMRHLAIPGSESIATAEGRQTIAGRMWFIPSNAVFARTLTLEMEAGRPATSRRLETQLLHFDGQGWNPYTYRWNAAQTDAELVAGEGATESLLVMDPAAPGGRREMTWRFHSRAECLRCHNSWAGDTLSFNWPQLTSSSAAPSEMDRLADLGLVRIKNPPKDRKSLVDPHAAPEPIEARARAWLHVNCAGCHRAGAGGAVPSHFDFEKPMREWRALDVKPARGDFGLSDPRVIAPGDPFRSVLLWRIATEGSGHMPMIGSRLVDPTGLEVVQRWIHRLNAPTLNARNPAGDNASTNSGAALALACAATAGEPGAREAAAAAARISEGLVRDLLQRFLPPDQRRRTLGFEINPQTILPLRGDLARGHALFFREGGAQCSRCHTCERQGREFGPDLSDIGRKYDRAALLDHILRPSAIIAPEFRTHLVSLRDDTELAGFVLRRASDALFLRTDTEPARRVPLDQIKEDRESAVSVMPEGLLAPLTAQEAADLVDFLSSRKADVQGRSITR